MYLILLYYYEPNLIPQVTDNQDGTERCIAYKKSSGQNSPGILFIAGFMSSKDANKPTALHSFCQKQGIPFVRYGTKRN